jgi:twitching motility protein PilT
MHVNDLLKIAVDRGASDVHLKAGSVPMMRVRGSLAPVAHERRLDQNDMLAIAAAVLPTAVRERFKETHEVNLAYSIPGVGRFRCNGFQQRGTIGMTFRVLPTGVPTLDELHLPPVLKTLAQQDRGLVLVAGGAGSGKSTTLAALIDEINSTRTAHVMTVEDPIEYLHRDKTSIVSQREVGVDTSSYAHALRSAMRQDSDVIVVGEMRDADTVETVMRAAESDRLVFSTLHARDASDAVVRLVSMFPHEQQRHVRAQLAAVLRSVVAQRLIPRAGGKGRVPAVEVMIATPSVRECIIDPERTHSISDALDERASEPGAQSFSASVVRLYARGLVDRDEAERWVPDIDQQVGAGAATRTTD